MLKKVLFGAVATALVAAVAVPVQFTAATAGPMTCKAAAKAKYKGDLKARHAFMKGCKAHAKAMEKA